MCKALEELKNEGVSEGMEKGMEKGMERGKILARYEDGMAPEEIAQKMGLTVEQVELVLKEYNQTNKIEHVFSYLYIAYKKGVCRYEENMQTNSNSNPDYCGNVK